MMMEKITEITDTVHLIVLVLANVAETEKQMVLSHVMTVY